MGIQSTTTLEREIALARIEAVYIAFLKKDTRWLSIHCGEHDVSAAEFGYTREQLAKIQITSLDSLSNDQLEELMDLPYIRNSMFDNYHIIDSASREPTQDDYRDDRLKELFASQGTRPSILDNDVLQQLHDQAVLLRADSTISTEVKKLLLDFEIAVARLQLVTW